MGLKQHHASWSATWLPRWFRCHLCEAPTASVLCTACAQRLTQPVARCTHCSVRLPDGGLSKLCASCLQQAPAWTSAYALADYSAPLDALVTLMKFGRQPALARWLGRQLAERLVHASAQAPAAASHNRSQVLAQVDLWLPVPLSAERLRERGFNQAWEILRGMRRDLKRARAQRQSGLTAERVDPGMVTQTLLARADVLMRLRDTAPQSDLNDPVARRRNVAQAFALASPVAGLRIGLVDDVMTSGATCAELSRVLLRAGAREVHVVVAMRTPRHELS